MSKRPPKCEICGGAAKWLPSRKRHSRTCGPACNKQLKRELIGRFMQCKPSAGYHPRVVAAAIDKVMGK